MIGVQVVDENSQTGSFSVFHRMTIFVLMKKKSSKKMLEKNLENTNKSFGHYRHQPINIDIVIDKLSRCFYKSTIMNFFLSILKKTRTLSYKLFWHKRNNTTSNPASQSGLQDPVTCRPQGLIEFEVLSTRNCDSLSSVMLQIGPLP